MLATLIGNFRVFHGGYPSKGNAHSGVAISINTSITPEKQIHSFAYPNDHRIAGRVMAIRIKTDSSDELHVCAYFPPYTSKHALKHTRLMLNWINQLFKKTPVRTVPMIGGLGELVRLVRPP